MTPMEEKDSRSEGDPIAESLYDLEFGDPEGELFDRSGLSPAEVLQIGRLMRALVDLREADQAIMVASEKYMRLSAQDMRALQYLIVAKNRGEVVTPSMIAAHLKISPASTTKLLNRLERAGHVVRRLHPADRRAFAIEITPGTESAAKETVGRQHAKRLNAAVRLTQEERETVIRFLRDMVQEMSIENAEWAHPAG